MADIFKANEDVMKRVTDLIKDHHPDLVLISDEIAVLFREKASKKGGRVVLGSSKKSPRILDILGDVNYQFIIELAGDAWMDLTYVQQTALLDHHLCALRAEEDEETGDVRYYVAPPDIGYYYDELERRGNWRPALDGETTKPVTAEADSALEDFLSSHQEGEGEGNVSEEAVQEESG